MIRRMEHNDIDAVIKIWFEGNCSAHHFIPSSYWASNLGYMQEVLPQAEVWIYSIEGQVVGFIGLDNGNVAGLFVDRDFRAQGIGHELISHAKSLYNRLSLCVYDKNLRAKEFYTREGFAPSERHIDDAINEVELVMLWER